MLNERFCEKLPKEKQIKKKQTNQKQTTLYCSSSVHVNNKYALVVKIQTHNFKK